MKKVVDGSGILVVMIIISMLLLICINVWRTTAYLVDVAVQKQVYEQNAYATEGLLRWAVALVKNNFDDFSQKLDQKVEKRISVGDMPSPLEQIRQMQGQVILKKTPLDSITICAKLLHNDTVKHEMSCVLKKVVRENNTHEDEHSEHYYLVQGWKRTS